MAYSLEKQLALIKKAFPKDFEEIAKLADQIDQLEDIKAAKTDFMAFVKKMWPGFITGRHHKTMAKVIEGVVSGKLKRSITNLAPRHPYALDTAVPTISGWRTIASIQVGDWVFGPDGKTVQVLGKSTPVEDELYEVTTCDGYSVVCSGSHEWLVSLGPHSGYYRYTTDSLLLRQEGKKILCRGVERGQSKTSKRAPRLPTLPPSKSAEYLAQKLKVHPYVLGLWLGDGHRSQAIITSHDSDMPEIRRYVEECGYLTTDQSTRMTFGISKLKPLLRELGVLNNKHIPRQYLIGSVDQRWELVRGLMDSDGSIHRSGQCSFTQKKEDILSDFRQLLSSLGIKNYPFITRAIFKGKDYGPVYGVTFFAKDCAKLKRKRQNSRDANPLRCLRSIKIKKLDRRGLVQCIEVDNISGMFQLGYHYSLCTNTKSEFFSYLLPAWYLGRFPQRKIIQTCATADMAIGWSRKVRNLVGSAEYQKIFPDVGLREDSKAAGRWHTSHGGEYFAVGAEGNVTGKGGDLIIIDDPTGEQQAVAALGDPSVYNKVYDWYVAGPRQRLQPGGVICVVQSRWATNDFSGKLLEAERQASGPNIDHWELTELPAIMPSGEPLWPEFWSLKELEATRVSLPPQRWLAQYMQQPSSDHAAILKRDWWQRWPHGEPPQCHLKMVTMDTAYSDKETADYSAVTTWGLFTDHKDGKDIASLILLDAWRGRLLFPELKSAAHKHYLKWQPDLFLVEAKASGQPLVYELRARGIPVSEYTPVRGTKQSPNTKIMRANSVSDIMASKIVWAPQMRWADDVIEECASFPGGADHDDYVDCVIMALMRFRQGGLLSLATDSWDSEPLPYRKRAFY